MRFLGSCTALCRFCLQVNMRVCLSAIWCLFGQKGSLLCSLSSAAKQNDKRAPSRPSRSPDTRVSVGRCHAVACRGLSKYAPTAPPADLWPRAQPFLQPPQSWLCIIWRICRRSSLMSCWCRKWRDDCVVIEAWNTWGAFGMMTASTDSTCFIWSNKIKSIIYLFIINMFLFIFI